MAVANGGSQTFSPGAFGAVTIGYGARVTFNAGIYRMASLTVDSGAAVTFATSGGEVILRVQGAVVWQAGTNTAADPTKVGLYSNGSTVQVLDGVSFPGSITAPNAAVTLNSGVTVSGCVAGQSVSFAAGAKVTGTTNPCSRWRTGRAAWGPICASSRTRASRACARGPVR